MITDCEPVLQISTIIVNFGITICTFASGENKLNHFSEILPLISTSNQNLGERPKFLSSRFFPS